MEQLAAAGVSIDEITSELLVAGVKAFADSYESLLEQIESKLSRLTTAEAAGD